MPALSVILAAVLQYGPAVLGDAEAIFQAVSHSEGGPEKINNVIAGLSHLLDHAVAAAIDLAPPTQPASPAPQAPQAGKPGFLAG